MAEEKALSLLRDKSGSEFPHKFVFWSGGKDSTTALHLALQVWSNPKVVFIDTGITIPETLTYVKGLSEKWALNLHVLKPRIDFWEYVAYAGFPIIRALWCRRLLKMEPIKQFLHEHHGWKVQILGIRKTESTARAKSWYYDREFRQHTRLKYTYNLLPILYWSSQQRDNYLKKHDIPVNPAYALYGTSGCYFCPFVKKKRPYLILKERYPELFDRIVEAEKMMRKGNTAWPGRSIVPILEQQHLKT